MYYFYSKTDSKKEPIMKTNCFYSRLEVAKYFAKIKGLPLKIFLKIFSISK